MCVGKALSHNFATVTLPVSEAPNWLGAGTPSAPGVTGPGPIHKGGRDQRVSIFYKYFTCDKESYGLTRRWLNPFV